jgi:hypothetical protein
VRGEAGEKTTLGVAFSTAKSDDPRAQILV